MPDGPSDYKQSLSGLSGELLVWFSPAFPVGGFAYSQGLETAVANDQVTDSDTLADWLSSVVSHGGLRNELILISLTMRAESDIELADLMELSIALQPSSERAKEACDQGKSFWTAYQAAWSVQNGTNAREYKEIALTSAVGLAARDYDLHVGPVLEAYSLAFVGNQVSAAIRLGAVGQFDGQRVIAGLLPTIRAQSARFVTATLEDLGSSTFGADLASLLHETQTTRLFRS